MTRCPPVAVQQVLCIQGTARAYCERVQPFGIVEIARFECGVSLLLCVSGAGYRHDVLPVNLVRLQYKLTQEI